MCRHAPFVSFAFEAVCTLCVPRRCGLTMRSSISVLPAQKSMNASPGQRPEPVMASSLACLASCVSVTVPFHILGRTCLQATLDKVIQIVCKQSAALTARDMLRVCLCTLRCRCYGTMLSIFGVGARHSLGDPATPPSPHHGNIINGLLEATLLRGDCDCNCTPGVRLVFGLGVRQNQSTCRGQRN